MVTGVIQQVLFIIIEAVYIVIFISEVIIPLVYSVLRLLKKLLRPKLQTEVIAE